MVKEENRKIPLFSMAYVRYLRRKNNCANKEVHDVLKVIYEEWA